MRIHIGASLSRAPISVVCLIYIRGRGGWRNKGMVSKVLSPGSDAILTPESSIFSILDMYTTYLPTYVRSPRSVTRERRNCDLYLPESAACRDWSVTEPPWLSNKFSRAHKGDNDPHSEWFCGSSESSRWIVAPMTPLMRFPSRA